MVKEFVVNELAGKHFIAYDNNNNAVDIGIAKKNDKINKKSKVLKELHHKNNDIVVKQEAIVLIDELIANAKYDKSKPTKRPHGWLDNYGKSDWDYWKVFIQEKNKTVWEATLNIANTTNGDKILYDIKPIKKVEEGIKSPSASTNNIISNLTENVNTKFSDKETEQSEKTFSYDELVAKDDLNGFVIDNTKQVKLNSHGNIDAQWVVTEVKKKCDSITTKSPTPTYYTNVPDIGRNVEISSKGITHGFLKSLRNTTKASSPRDILNARVTLEIPQILKNSIEVNRSSRVGNDDSPFSHVMIGTVGIEDDNGNIEYCAVRTVIEERINQDPILVEAEILGKLHAINAKKIGTPSVQTTENGDALTGSVAYTYNVAQFLEDVKTEFDDTFSEDVYQKLGMQRFNNDFSKNLLFQDKSQESIYDIMGENERLRKQNEFWQAEVERIKERLALEKKVTNGNYFDTKQIGTVAALLRKKGNSDIDKVELMKALKGVYSYIAEKSNNIDEDYLKWKLREIAGRILAEGKPQTVTNDYSKMILKTIRDTKITLNNTQKAEAQNIFGKNWNRNFFGRANIVSEGGTMLDVQWNEWAKQYPTYFDENISDADMPGQLFDILGRLKDTSEIVQEYDKELMTNDLAVEIFRCYWNLSPIKTTADK